MNVSTGPTATAVADRGLPSSKASSPKKPPGTIVVRIAGSAPSSGVTRIFTEPFETIESESPGSPSWKITSPRRNLRTRRALAHSAIPASSSPANRRHAWSASRTSGSTLDVTAMRASYGAASTAADRGAETGGLARSGSVRMVRATTPVRLALDGLGLLSLRRRCPGPLPAVRELWDAARGQHRAARDPPLRDGRQLRPEGLHCPRRTPRPRVVARRPDPLLRRDAGDLRVAWWDDREDHRRRDRRGLRHPRPSGRRRAAGRRGRGREPASAREPERPARGDVGGPPRRQDRRRDR